MTLYELGEDYLKQNEFIRQKIRLLTSELKTKQGNDYIKAKSDIALLYAMSSELRKTARVLMHYYDHSSDTNIH